ncbi:hypothetical protein [Methanimicrococcus hongohii]|uniref:hypothetical protein n=1 Tax=Methanimicrococcus hongohii TaxID=3028295 RepID=UPI00292D429D|nr:hypothetical protein [Methanimicrococcus sp. Hf6]
MSSYACLLLLPDPAKPASLQLSFVVAAEAVSVSACICSFLRNPLALNFARLRLTKFQNGRWRRCLFAMGGRCLLPLLPAGFYFHCYLTVSVCSCHPDNTPHAREPLRFSL